VLSVPVTKTIALKLQFYSANIKIVHKKLLESKSIVGSTSVHYVDGIDASLLQPRQVMRLWQMPCSPKR
jgi:hypothetical protein